MHQQEHDRLTALARRITALDRPQSKERRTVTLDQIIRWANEALDHRVAAPGHPHHWEFRLSPDQQDIAIWQPGNEPWFIPERNMRGRFTSSAAMDAQNWFRFLKAEE